MGWSINFFWQYLFIAEQIFTKEVLDLLFEILWLTLRQLMSIWPQGLVFFNILKEILTGTYWRRMWPLAILLACTCQWTLANLVACVTYVGNHTVVSGLDLAAEGAMCRLAGHSTVYTWNFQATIFMKHILHVRVSRENRKKVDKNVITYMFVKWHLSISLFWTLHSFPLVNDIVYL